jgi:flagellar FliL protein
LFDNLQRFNHFRGSETARSPFRARRIRRSNCIVSSRGEDATKMSANSGAAPAVASQKSSSAMIVSMVLFALVAGGAAVWFVQQRERASDAVVTRESSSAPKYVIHLEGFTVNLADPEETHFLRATIDLGIDRLPDGAQKDKLAGAVPVPRIRDSILSVLTVCKANDLLTPEGKARLKKDLLDVLNRNVPEIAVREIYFTEFLVQR